MDKIRVKNCRIIKLPAIRDARGGCLSFAEGSRDVPFEIKRVYYIYDLSSEGGSRGAHAHKKLQQVIFCINGSCCLDLDDGTNKQSLFLSEPHVGIYMGAELWHTMRHFSENCMLVVLASDYHDETDYLRDYSQFIEHIGRRE